MAAPGKCHEEKAPQGGRPLSKILLPHYERTFPCPCISPWVAALPELQFTNGAAQEGRNILCLEPQGHCRHQGHVDDVLVPCHAVGHAGGCQSCC